MNAEGFEFEVEREYDRLFALAFDGFGNEPQPNFDYATYRCCHNMTYCFCSPWERLLADYDMEQLEDARHHIDLEPVYGPVYNPLSGVCVECGGHWVTCPCDPF